MKISKWPAEQDAWRLLRIVGEQRTPGYSESRHWWRFCCGRWRRAGEEAGRAREVLGTLLVTVPDSPVKAVRLLLSLDGKEETATHQSLMNAATREEAARVILSLANQAARPS
jgi:hypothetical protein